jgi:micrococcal nuclease
MSKRRRTGIIVLCLLVTTLLVRLDRCLHNRGWLPESISAQQTSVHDIEKYHGKTFVAVNVIDGDTIDVNVPDGQSEYTRIRLLGIDAPETHSETLGEMYFSGRATRSTEQLTLGKSIAVYLDKPDPTRGKYGRLLTYVKLSDGRFLNEVLLSEGFAYADLRFSHSFYNKYKQLEAAARSRRKGLWRAVTREQLPKWLQERDPDLPRKN